MTTTYLKDEVTLEMSIRLPSCYPLKSIEVSCFNHSSGGGGVPEGKWRRWELQMRNLLNQSDEGLVAAISFWISNLDKEFEGVEPCPICYSILHNKLHVLPNLQCRTCKNKFHSNCLFKWFASSQKNKCVICQQPF